METRQDNALIDCLGAVYAKNYTKLSGTIDHVRSIWKQDRTTMWLILQVQSMSKSKLNCHWPIEPDTIYHEN